MPSTIRISDTAVNAEEVMRQIRRTIAEKRKDPAYQQYLRRMDQFNGDDSPKRTGMHSRLIDLMHLPPTHRKGLLGKLASMALSKLYLATRSFLSGTLAAQDHINRRTDRLIMQLNESKSQVGAKELAIIHKDIADVAIRLGEKERAYQHLLLALKYDPDMENLADEVREAFHHRSQSLLENASSHH